MHPRGAPTGTHFVNVMESNHIVALQSFPTLARPE
jgi:hypothetical protein